MVLVVLNVVADVRGMNRAQAVLLVKKKEMCYAVLACLSANTQRGGAGQKNRKNMLESGILGYLWRLSSYFNNRYNTAALYFSCSVWS